ncbi:MAG TPA: hypothetical protein VF655_04425 [Allosphingosinicella sp.]|jgi:hypothetical protein
MARRPLSPDKAIARFDEVAARLDGSPQARAAQRRYYGRVAGSVGKRLGGMGISLAVLIVATILFSQLVAPIGMLGLFMVVLLTLGVLLFFSLSGGGDDAKPVELSDEVPTKRVVQQLESLLVRERPALPAPAARRVDAITQSLPMLEQQLAELNPLDPVAQDARRLMGKHLPELFQRYESVPAPYRAQRDGEGLTVDERLVAGLDTAQTALSDIGARLAQGKREALESHGRFIESRYKNPGGLGEP